MMFCTSGMPSSDPQATNQRAFPDGENGGTTWSYNLPVGTPTRSLSDDHGGGALTATGAAATGLPTGAVVAVHHLHEAKTLGSLLAGVGMASDAGMSGFVFGVLGAIPGALIGLGADLGAKGVVAEQCTVLAK